MKLNCVNVATVNPEVMRDFYSLLLNAPANDFLAPDRYEIRAGEVSLVIVRVSTPTVVNPESCGLEFITDDVDAEYERLTAAGIRTENQPTTLPWNYRYFAVKDPDGNNIDVVQNLDP